MKKTIYIFLALLVGQRSVAQQAYLGVTLSQDILALSPASFGGTLTDEQQKVGLEAELVAMYSIYNRNMNYGCPTEKEPVLSEDIKPYEGKIVLVELDGDCPFGQKIAKVEAQGAVAVVLLQKEKSENFSLEGDELAKESQIPCFILRDFEENTRLFRFAPSHALLYIAAEGHGKMMQTQQQNPSTMERENKDLSSIQTSAVLQVAPNPASDILNISYQMPSETGLLRLFDIGGKALKSIDLATKSATLSISCTDLIAGVYILELTYPEGKYSKQVIIR